MKARGKLFGTIRQCVKCGRAPFEGARILAVSMSVYRKGAGKSALRGCGAVRICEQCLLLMLAGNAPLAGDLFIAAIAERMRVGYEKLISADQTHTKTGAAR